MQVLAFRAAPVASSAASVPPLWASYMTTRKGSARRYWQTIVGSRRTLVWSVDGAASEPWSVGVGRFRNATKEGGWYFWAQWVQCWTETSDESQELIILQQHYCKGGVGIWCSDHIAVFTGETEDTIYQDLCQCALVWKICCFLKIDVVYSMGRCTIGCDRKSYDTEYRKK